MSVLLGGRLSLVKNHGSATVLPAPTAADVAATGNSLAAVTCAPPK